MEEYPNLVYYVLAVAALSFIVAFSLGSLFMAIRCVCLLGSSAAERETIDNEETQRVLQRWYGVKNGNK